MARMPVLFVGHGSPMNVIEHNGFTEGWAAAAARIPRPTAILCVSAHWFDEGEAVSGAAHPNTIYDFYGFPEELYKITYPAPGAPALAQRVAQLSGRIAVDPGQGLDHGAWSLLHHMYPKADVPVCQLRVNAANSARQSYEMGAVLQPLRDEGVLILGSGNVVHNLAMIDWEGLVPGGYSWANSFDDYIRDAVLAGRHDHVIDFTGAGEGVGQAFRYRDHYDPLLYVLGATQPGEPVRVFNDARVMGSLSMTSYQIG